jgi:hypothetical protein
MTLESTQPRNRNEYQEYFLGGKGGRCVGLTALPPSCTDCLDIWEPQPPETLRAYTGIALRVLFKFVNVTCSFPHPLLIQSLC